MKIVLKNGVFILSKTDLANKKGFLPDLKPSNSLSLNLSFRNLFITQSISKPISPLSRWQLHEKMKCDNLVLLQLKQLIQLLSRIHGRAIGSLKEGIFKNMASRELFFCLLRNDWGRLNCAAPKSLKMVCNF